MRFRLQSLAAYFFILLTGAAGLIYEVTWQKCLSMTLGCDTIAGAIILATFLGGLSIGYFLCGEMTLISKNHFRLYALLEMLIGLWALCCPTILNLLRQLTADWSFDPAPLMILQGVFYSAVLTGVPAFCMGATVPVLTRAISKNVSEATRVHAGIYGLNTGGAFLGALAAGFFLIPALGISNTLRLTAMVNLSAAGYFYIISRSAATPRTSETAIHNRPAMNTLPRYGLPRHLLYAVAFLSGFYVMTLENVLIRLMNLSFGSSSYSFSIVVAVFVLAIALGSYVFSRFKKVPEHSLYINQLLICFTLLALYFTLDTWPYWAHLIRLPFESTITGFWTFYATVLAVLAVLLLIPAGLMGATVPIVFHMLKNELRRVGAHSGSALALNTMGSLSGSIVGGIFFYYFLNNGGVFLAAVLLVALSACFSSWDLPIRYRFASAVFAGAVLVFAVYQPFFDEKRFAVGTFRMRMPLLSSFSGPKAFFREFHTDNGILFYEDSPTGTVSVIQSPLQPWSEHRPLAIMVNGKSDSSTIGDMYTIRLAAHIPALLSRQKSKALVVGLGTGVTAGELSLYPDIAQIDVAEISPAVVRALPLFGAFTHSVQNDPRLRIHTGDALRIMERSREKWDLIISEPSNPWVNGVDTLFTREFYQIAKRRLSEGGKLLQWIHIYEANEHMIGMIMNTIRQEFPFCRVFMSQANDLLILAANNPIGAEDLAGAESELERNQEVRSSLDAIGLGLLDSILLREIWSPSFVCAHFGSCPIQTMDKPVLHYIAGKAYFLGERVPEHFIFSSSTAPYTGEFLLSARYCGANSFPLTPHSFSTLLPSACDRTRGESFCLPMYEALKLNAYLRDPFCYPLSDEESRKFDVNLLNDIMNEKLDHSGAFTTAPNALSIEKAVALLKQIERTRNWIVPYSRNGLCSLLKEGTLHSHRIPEKIWFAMQLARIRSEDRISSTFGGSVFRTDCK